MESQCFLMRTLWATLVLTDGEILKIMNMRVSRKAQEQLKPRLEQIALEYEDQARADAHMSLALRGSGSLYKNTNNSWARFCWPRCLCRSSRSSPL